MFTRCTIRNQHDILKTAVADVSKGQADMSHKGELHTLTKLSMRHQVSPIQTCCMIISESIITMLISGGRSYILCEYIALFSFIIQGAYLLQIYNK